MSAPPGPAVPPVQRTRDWYAPAIVAASLTVHVAALALLVRPPVAVAAPPAEIPVEVVALPAAKPPPPPPPMAAPTASAAAKPAAEPRAAAAPTPAKSRTAQAREAAAEGADVRRAVAKQARAKVATARPAGMPEAAAGPGVAERMRQLLGPMPAAVMPTAAAGDSALDDTVSYRQLVLSQVARQRREDRHNGVPGHVVVSFAVGDAGEVVRCAVREKSVDPALDAEAVAMVYRGAPYPPPPPGAERGFSFGLAFRPS